MPSTNVANNLDVNVPSNAQPPATRKVMIVTNQVPGHDIGFQQSGHAAYLQSFIDHFRGRDYEIVLVALRPRVDFLRLPSARLPYRLLSPATETVGEHVVLRAPEPIFKALALSVYSRLPRALQSAAQAMRVTARKARGYTHQLGRFLSDGEIRFVHDVQRAERPSIVLYDSIFNCCARVDGAQRWVITGDVKYLRARSFEARAVGVFPPNVGREVEARILEEVGNIVAIHADDAGEFRRMAPASRIAVVPVTLKRTPAPRSEDDLDATCVFVGSGSFHNLDGIRWFLECCWPKVRAAMPAAKLEIVGTVSERLGSIPQGVTVRGVVPDLAAAYERAAVAIVPLRIGSGLKMKLVEALAFRRPIVTTAIGAQGLMGVAPRPFLLADSEDEFISKTLEVLRSASLRAELAEAAGHCAGLFEPDRAFAEFALATEVAVA